MPKMIVCKGECGEAFTDAKEAYAEGWRKVTEQRYMCPNCMAKMVSSKLFMDNFESMRKPTHNDLRRVR